jgi:hypothetical protein
MALFFRVRQRDLLLQLGQAGDPAISGNIDVMMENASGKSKGIQIAGKVQEFHSYAPIDL